MKPKPHLQIMAALLLSISLTCARRSWAEATSEICPAFLDPHLLMTETQNLGDLSTAEIHAIQYVVDRSGYALVVVGSAAKAKRRNQGTDLQIGKGHDGKSDIDYTVPVANALDQVLADHDLARISKMYEHLPALDWHGVGIGLPDFKSERIWFRPHQSPVALGAGTPNLDIPPYPSRYAPNEIASRRDAIELKKILTEQMGIWWEQAVTFSSNQQIVEALEEKRARVREVVKEIEEKWHL